MWTPLGWSACWKASRDPPVTQGALPNHNDPPPDRTDSDAGDRRSRRRADREGIGRSRGGLSTKIHLLADTRGRPLARATTVGQRGDALAAGPLLDRLTVRRPGRGRPRTRPSRLLGDKAYSSRALRGRLRRQRIRAVIPEPADQQANRRRRGSAGGRPPAFDTEAYKQRNSTERCVNKLKANRAVALRSDKRLYIFEGTTDVASMRIWTRDLTRHHPSDTP